MFKFFNLIIFVVGLSFIFIVMCTPFSSQARDIDTNIPVELEKGQIDLIPHDNSIVINDILFSISNTTIFYSPEGQQISAKGIKVGDVVLYRASDNMVLQEIHLQQNNASANNGKEDSNSIHQQWDDGARNPIHLDHGVWRN